MRTRHVIVLAAPALVPLAACGGGSEDPAGADRTAPQSPAAATVTVTRDSADLTRSTDSATPTRTYATPLKVGVAYDVGGRGDSSFNDSAAKGVDRAKRELGVTGTEVEASPGETDSGRESRLRGLVAQGNTVIIVVGYTYAKAVGTVAREHPEVKFAILDDASPTSAGPNIAQVTFAENEGSYLAGAAAALKTKSDHIGFIGGVQTPLIKQFEAGFVAGAKKVDPAIKVDTAYLTQIPDMSGFADPAKGKTVAQGLYRKGVDVVYHAAGDSGAGVFDAASSAGEGTWAIGVDSDQGRTAKPSVRPRILTSMVKNVDVGVYAVLTSVRDGDFRGGERVLGLKEGGVSLARTGGHLRDVRPRLDRLTKQIVNGGITVPTGTS